MPATLWKYLCSIGEETLSVILPEKARAARIRLCRPEDFQLNPTTHELREESIIALLDYKAPGVSDLIRALKYEHSGHAADIAAAILADYLREEIAHIKAFSPRPLLLVPVALHASRQRERGFNQIEKILARLPKEFRDGTLATVSPRALTRVRATPQQTRLSRQERITNVARAFSADDGVKDTHCILIDDVTTTGATISECARTLRAHGARVTSLALARA